MAHRGKDREKSGNDHDHATVSGGDAHDAEKDVLREGRREGGLASHE